MKWKHKNKNRIRLPYILRKRNWYTTTSPYDRILLLLEQDPNAFSDIESMRNCIGVSTGDIEYLCKIGFIEPMSEYYKEEELDEKQKIDIKNSYRLTINGFQHLNGLHVKELTEKIKVLTKVLIWIGLIQIVIMLFSLIVSLLK